MKELIIREAIPIDAAELLAVFKQIGGESEFLTMDEAGVAMTTEEMAENLANIYESKNNALLIAIVDGAIVGSISVYSDHHYRIRHIGEFAVSLLTSYQGYGIGSALMEEMIEWAKESGVIRRLELTVQKRNTGAIRLYQKYGFEIEAEQKRGARLKSGEFISVLRMSLLID
ncbi:MAG: GNAT family N-acetyltransferase [Streptococcaceae bacterium]|jgi:RimJ/RimL family protein N-acetyltransferase|nr:GNAT family N-acetyltransferase [Streptococcaceae bacterium]